MATTLQEWALHDQFGEDFRNLVAAIETEFGPPPTATENPPPDTKEKDPNTTGTGRKRAGNDAPPPPKKTRVDAGNLIALEKVGDAGVLLEVPLVPLEGRWCERPCDVGQSLLHCQQKQQHCENPCWNDRGWVWEWLLQTTSTK